MQDNGLRFTETERFPSGWIVPIKSIVFDSDAIKAKLLDLSQPCYVVQDGNRVGVSHEAILRSGAMPESYWEALAFVAPLPIERLGDAQYQQIYGTRYAYYTGAMANGIASVKQVVALGKAKFLGSFGAAGLVPAKVEEAIKQLQQALPQGPYAFNLIHSPSEPALEQGSVDLFLKYQVPVVEASAYLDLTPQIVQYRAAGLSVDAQGTIQIKNKVIAKISRTEVATKFMQPATEKFLSPLVQKGLITKLQAQLAQQVPMADDITAEADSGGHTDNRPFVTLLPTILSLRDKIQAQYNYATPLRVGGGGGIGTPNAALAAFMMGASYIVTGSVNQACIEAGSSEHTRKLLAQADMADVTMAPAADMFEMGVKLQVLKRGTLFPMRAQKLYELYQTYNSIEEIPAAEREKIEKQIFRSSLEDIWKTTVDYFKERDPHQIERTENHPKRKMALIFRWYLGLSSRWSNSGEKGREMDYQIWTGPAMGAFNAWTQNSYLADLQNRKVVDVAKHLMTGAAFLYRIQNLKLQGVLFSTALGEYIPHPFE
ncbi:PfaD family polyunsaturated fatty acid/polyketide biosynthesis protein [Deltaproteobacteria bacterium TL4]